MTRREKRHPLDNVGPEIAIQVRCMTCRKVVLVGEFRDELIPAVARHYFEDHDGTSGVLVEGEDGHFVIEKAPYRCDLCGIAAERPWWEYSTPALPGVQDPEWLVCDACAPLVDAHDTLGLVRRCVHVGVREFDMEANRIREHALGVVPRFLSHVEPSLTRRIEI